MLLLSVFSLSIPSQQNDFPALRTIATRQDPFLTQCCFDATTTRKLSASVCRVPQHSAARLTTRDDDDEQKHDYAHDDPDPHLHILPPHLLADSVGATTEALGGLVQVLGFVLKLVNVLAALGYGFEVLLHDIDGIVDLLGWRRVSAIVFSER